MTGASASLRTTVDIRYSEGVEATPAHEPGETRAEAESGDLS